MAKGNPPIDLRRVVVDTGPLFNVLVLVFFRNSPIHRPSGFESTFFGGEHYLYGPNNQAKFLDLFDRIQKILITSHVIGELVGLHKKLIKAPLGIKISRGEFWLSSVDYLREKVDERLLRFIDICDSDEGQGRRIVSEIGPTDAGLIELARKEKCVLLTDDGDTLARQAWDMDMGDQCKLVRYLLTP
jgi:rRNA-processing protein FCF1